MRAAKNGDHLALTFNLLEGELLRGALQQVALNYRAKPEDLPPKAAAALYSTRGCKTAKMSASETREWLENLHQYRSANIEHAVRWSRQLEADPANKSRLLIKLEEAPILLTLLNDHRLLLAARHDIGQEEMDIHTLSALNSLPPARSRALVEVHFLAAILEQILCFLPGKPGRWNDEAAEGSAESSSEA